MRYGLGMKEGIDHIGVAIVFWCHDGKGNVLMAKRMGSARDEHGRWDIGGALEFGETIDERLRKEVEEEYCTDVLEYEFLGYRNVHREENGVKSHWVGLDFKVLVDRDKAKNGEPDKLEKLEWFTLNNLPEPLHSQGPEFIKKYRNKLQ